MKNINYINLFQNIVRCVIVYPLIVCFIVLSIPFNPIVWLFWILELIGVFFNFIFTGKNNLEYTIFGMYVLRNFYEDPIFTLIPITFYLIDCVYDFNRTLKPIYRPIDNH